MASVALVVLDTLRKDYFEKHFDWLPGARFDRCLATSNWTIPTHASLFTGRYASEVGTYARSTDLVTDYPTLGDVTTDHTSRFYSANPQMGYFEGWTDSYDDVMSPWEIKQPDSTHLVDWDQFAVTCNETGVRRYFEALRTAYRHDGPTLRSLKKGYEASMLDRTDADDSGARAIRDRLRDTAFGSDEFVFINLMEAHSPYTPPEPYRTVEEDINPVFADRWAETPPDRSVARQAYDDAVRYLSDAYEEIHEQLTQAVDYVVTVADHGELLGDHGHWNHVHGLYPELTHVPLVVSGADVPEATTESVVSLLDVHRTVAELLGIADKTESRGRSLLSSIASEPQYTEFHGLPQWIQGQLESRGVAAKYETYNRPLYGVRTANGDYGYQSVDGARGDLSDAELEDHVESFTATVPTEFDDSDGAVDDAVRKRLEDLGYA
jgi:arylsulfatase